jgi:hypothetical protein
MKQVVVSGNWVVIRPWTEAGIIASGQLRHDKINGPRQRRAQAGRVPIRLLVGGSLVGTNKEPAVSSLTLGPFHGPGQGIYGRDGEGTAPVQELIARSRVDRLKLIMYE